MSLLQSINSPMKIREELEQMVVADLLGPVGGPDEEVVERTVQDRYLVGVLAPRRRKDEPLPRLPSLPDPLSPIVCG